MGVSPGNGGSAPGRLGATRSADQPDQAAVQKAFDSVQSSQEGMLGASRGPPVPLGSLPIDALQPLQERRADCQKEAARSDGELFLFRSLLRLVRSLRDLLRPHWLNVFFVNFFFLK